MKAHLFILVLCLSACASRQDRRAVDVCLPDTVYRVDTFVTTLHDTVRIDTGRMHVRIVRHVDTLLVDARCDTVYVEVPRPKQVPEKSVSDWVRRVIFILQCWWCFLWD